MKPEIISLRERADALGGDRNAVTQVTESLQETRGHGALVGAALLAATEDFLRRFVSYPSEHARVAHVLWVAHTHAMLAWDSTPRIAFLSPEPGSGKSRALEVTELLVPRPVQTINASAAYLFRRIGDQEHRPTVLFDEADAMWGPKAKHENEEVRALINAGHRRASTVGRCVLHGNTVRTEDMAAYAAVALAGLGDLPDTVLTRSVIIRMRRRAPHEHVEAFRRRVHEPEGHALRDALSAWGAGVEHKLEAARPSMPESVSDRDADVWESLLAVADEAGGAWPARARAASIALVAESKSSTPSLGVRLLEDLRNVFGEDSTASTESLLRQLTALDEGPWADLKGKPLDSRGLAHRLKPYGVRSTTIRDGQHVFKGYKRADFVDAWARYVPAPPPQKAPRRRPIIHDSRKPKT